MRIATARPAGSFRARILEVVGLAAGRPRGERKGSAMPQDNATLVRSLYEAFGRGDVPTVLGAMDPGIVWNEAENFPYADRNPYVGPDAVLQGVFMRLATEWDGFRVNLQEVHGAGDVVLATGRYGGAYKKTGTPINLQFAHVWKLRGEKVVGFQQYTDTLQASRAVGG
jgi:ketosteroid isomerase-like protein